MAPDLARGLMLLLIALANVPWYLYGSEPGLSAVHPRDGSSLDAIVQAVIITTVDMRVYPMFAFLFGYGMVQLFRRQIDAGTGTARSTHSPPAQRLADRVRLRRRRAAVDGRHPRRVRAGRADHGGALLPSPRSDVADLGRRRHALLTLGMIFAVVGSFFAAQAGGSSEQPSFFTLALAVAAEENYLASIPMRLLVWAILTPLQGVLSLVVPIVILLAFWAGRREILERPAEHRRLLRRVAVIGIAIGWAGGLPNALDHVGVLPVPDQVAWVFSATQGLTGMCAGVGYVAAFGLLRSGWHRRARATAYAAELGAPIQAVVGRRSPLPVVLSRAVGHLRAAALRLGSGPGCGAGQRDGGTVRDRRVVAHGGRRVRWNSAAGVVRRRCCCGS